MQSSQKNNRSILLPFLSQIVSDWRYWFLAVFFATAIFIGQNVSPNEPISTPRHNNSAPEISAKDIAYSTANIMDTQASARYRLQFQTRIQNRQHTPDNSERENVEIVLSNSTGLSQRASEISVPIGTDAFVDQDIFFSADGEYEKILFKKKNTNSVSEIFVRNIHLVKLEGNNPILPSFLGFFDHSSSTEKYNIDDAQDVFQLNRHNVIVGDIFEARARYITGVNLKLGFKGNGGNGYYKIVLKETDGRTILNSNLAEIAFNPLSAPLEYAADKVNNLYYFPLSAQLSIGKEYFIGVEYTDVAINYLNSLLLYGKSTTDQNSRTVQFNRAGEMEMSDKDLYIKYHMANKPNYGSKEANFGDMFYDLGNGTGIYSYSNSKIFSGLDIHDSGLDFSTYKIDTFYPYNALFLTAGLSGSKINKGYHLYLSFDNNNWTEIEDDSSKEPSGHFFKKISGDGNNTTLYIKLTGNVFDREIISLDSLSIQTTVKTIK